MDELIQALQILRKYGNPPFPTHCEHDVLHVAVSPEGVSEEDLAALEELHFTPDDYEGFYSFYFGSC